MQSDFEAKSLKNANRKLDEILLEVVKKRESTFEMEKTLKKKSLWQKLLSLVR